MEITEVSNEVFARQLPANHAFNSAEFAELHRGIADNGDVRYLLFSDSKIRAGIILGRRGNTLCSPFSAPFGGLVPARGHLAMESVDAIINCLTEYCSHSGFSLSITLPPLWFDPDLTSKTVESLLSHGFAISADISYHIDLCQSIEICKSARKKLRQAVDAGLCFSCLEPTRENITRVYNVLLDNHSARGYKMRRTLENYLAVNAIMQADYFIVSYRGEDIAAAVNYSLSPATTIGVGWGDRPEFSNLRPMNLLAASMIDYYKSLGFSILDLGPAAENGVISPGLCSFKESIGAQASLKFSFIMK